MGVGLGGRHYAISPAGASITYLPVFFSSKRGKKISGVNLKISHGRIMTEKIIQ